MKLHVAADESGVHGNPSHCLVIGYIGTPRHWNRLERQWKKILAQYSVSDFHAKRFFARDKRGGRLDYYKGWSAEKAMSFLNDLLFCIDQCRLFPIGGAVDVPSFDALTYGERRFLTGGNFTADRRWLTSGAPSKPYYVALEHLIVEALNRASQDTTIHFLFDRQEVLGARAVQTFNEIVGRAPARSASYYAEPLIGVEKLGHLSFGERPKEPSLQAADLLTHSWYGLLSRGEKRMSDERLYAMMGLTRKRQDIRIYNTEGFEIVLSKLPSEVRAALQAEHPPAS